MSHLFHHRVPGVEDAYGEQFPLNGNYLSTFLDDGSGHFSLGPDCYSTCAEDLGAIQCQPRGLEGFSPAEIHSITLLPGHQIHYQKAFTEQWIPHGLREPELSSYAYTTSPTSALSPCFSDDLSDQPRSPSSSASSQCGMPSSWHYPNIPPPHIEPTTGYSALSSIQTLPDELSEALEEAHGYSYSQFEDRQMNGVANANLEDDMIHLGVQRPQANEIAASASSRLDYYPATPLSATEEEAAGDSDYKPSRRSGRSKRQRHPSEPAASGSQTKTRSHRRTSSEKVGLKKKRRIHMSKRSDSLRPFPCPLAGYGCEATFASKNEWKRHVGTQHVKLGFWRCNLCPLSSDPKNPMYNDFNRKDLFTQHLRRMHTREVLGLNNGADSSIDADIPEHVIAEYQARCFHHLRQHPLRSGCLFCPQVFEGVGSWEQRMEHLGAHFEKEKKNIKASLDTSRWNDDPELQEWFLQEGLIEADTKGGWRIGNGQPRRDIEGV